MIPISTRYLILLLCVITTQFSVAQDRYVETKLFTADDISKGDIIDFEINTAAEGELLLVIASKSEITLFVDDQLLFHVTNDSIPITRLGRGKVSISAFTGRASPRLSLVKRVRSEGLATEPLIRSERGFQDFVSVYVSILLIFLSMIKWYQGKDIADLFRIDPEIQRRNNYNQIGDW